MFSELLSHLEIVFATRVRAPAHCRPTLYALKAPYSFLTKSLGDRKAEKSAVAAEVGWDLLQLLLHAKGIHDGCRSRVEHLDCVQISIRSLYILSSAVIYRARLLDTSRINSSTWRQLLAPSMRLLYLLTAAFAVAIAAPALDQAASCHDYVLVVARGTGEHQGPSASFSGMAAWTLGNVSHGAEYDVVYPASDDLDTSPGIGADDALAYIKNGSVACPKQKYALLGYSQGAWVQLLVLREISGTALEPLVAAVVTTGNPFQIRGQPVTVDQNGMDASRNGTGAFRGVDLTLGYSQHWVESGKVQNICYLGDPICDVYKLAGGNLLPHIGYIDLAVQKEGAQWLISHLR